MPKKCRKHNNDEHSEHEEHGEERKSIDHDMDSEREEMKEFTC